MNALFKSTALAACAALLATSCTLKNADAPPLTGPSEFGTAIVVEANPDVLPTDGGSQARITITARDSNGQPLANRTLRVEMLVNGVPTDFGSLSARTVVTNSQGQAFVTYTAPAVATGVDSGAQVGIGVTPLGTDASSSLPRIALIRLVPPGVVIGPSGLAAQFTVNPESPATFQPTFFDASGSTSSANNPIVSYRWDFSDGTVLTGAQVSKTFSSTGDQAVRLTISDAFGRTATTNRTVTVFPSVGPTAAMTISPNDPQVGEEVFFNGAASTAPTGRRIVRYEWNFGNGQTAEGVTASVRYTTARTYNVTLTVTDDVGRTDTETGQVTVDPATAGDRKR